MDSQHIALAVDRIDAKGGVVGVRQRGEARLANVVRGERLERQPPQAAHLASICQRVVGSHSVL